MKNARNAILLNVLPMLIITAITLPVYCFGSLSGNSLKGRVTDNNGQPLQGIVVQIQELKVGTVTDSNGKYFMDQLPAGYYEVLASAINFKSDSVKVFLNGKTVQNFTLRDNSLNEVVVTGERFRELHTVTQTELSGIALLQSRGASLGEALKELPGLNSIQTGPSLSKPVIHGLHSNRVLIMNDGVRQEGQQWGSEHAPEIDPFLANKITVIKGAAGVRYGSDAIGGVVLLSPDDLPTQKGITGDVYLIGASNGRMGAFSGMLQGAFDKKLKGLSWRIQGTLKEAGNFKTPNYYLVNTGMREGDFSANVCYKWKRFDFDVFYSQYNYEVGIFAGAESGSLKDLLEKFSESKPALPSYFTYNIDRSYQVVYHELIKARISYDLEGKGKLELTAARQNDIRNEYDSDLPYTKNPTAQYNSPQLSFQLITHTVDLIYTRSTKNGFSGSMGFTGATSGNIEEGIRTLLPNFRDYNGGAFAIERYTLKKFTFEAGLRYDYRWLRVYERNQTTLAIYDVTYQYSNASGTIGSTYHYNDNLSASVNVGTAWRAPSINEMYINGVHFSDASYELGDSTLKSERSINTGLSVNYTSNKLRATVDVYYNSIGNYIFELPVFPPRQPPSGTYPTFQFTQADVIIHGIDAQVQYDVLPQFSLLSKTTIVRGYNMLIHNWLVWMPCDRFENGIEYHLPTIGKLQQPYLSFENVSVLKQTRVPPNSDYVPPPAAYSLFNANAGFTLPINKNTLSVSFTVNNITNITYRDYLDHFRYYADELGVNYILRLKYSF